MAFPDPISVTIGGTATSLARLGMTLNEGSFADTTGVTSAVITSDNKNRYHRSMKLRADEIVVNPSIPDQNMAVSYQAVVSINFPKNGYDKTKVVNYLKALAAFIGTGTNADKLVEGQL
jgi:hypothetical protein